jgi:hypothetical protein
MTEKRKRFFSRKEENKVPDEGKSLMSVKQAKEPSRTCTGTQELKLLKTKETKEYKMLVMLYNRTTRARRCTHDAYLH